MIPIPEEGSTATSMHSSKTVTRTATFSTTNTTRRVVISTSVGKKLFCNLKIPAVPLAGRLVHFQGSWEKLTKNQNILQIVKWYRIPFLCRPKQKRELKEINFSMQEKETISLEVENLLKKGAVEQVCPQKDQSLSNIFIVKKKDAGNRPVIKLMELNQYIPFLHFKMESLQSLKTLLQKNMCKLDLKDAYFVSHFLRTTEREWCFDRKEPCTSFYACALAFHQLICFHKIPKDPYGPFKKDRDVIVIYLDDMLIIGRAREETIALRDTIILFLQCLGFVINKSRWWHQFRR